MKQAQPLASERVVAEEMILMYFNNYLYQMGVITQKKRNQMVAKIAARGARKTKKRAPKS